MKIYFTLVSFIIFCVQMLTAEDTKLNLITKHLYIENENRIEFELLGNLPAQETNLRIILSTNNLVIFTANTILKEKNTILFSQISHSPEKVIKCQLEIKDLTNKIYNLQADVYLYGHDSIHPKISKNTKIIRFENEYTSFLTEKLKLETIKLNDLKPEESYQFIFENLKLEKLNDLIEVRKQNKNKTKIYILSNCYGNLKIANKPETLVLSNKLQNNKNINMLASLSNYSMELETNKENGYSFVFIAIENIEIVYFGFPFDKEIPNQPEALLLFDKLINNNLWEFLK